MTARIAGFVTRADAGLRSPNTVSRNITPSRGGVAVHYGGPAQRLTSPEASRRRWKAWQDFHMAAPRNWADIAYTGAFDDFGYAYAGRGAGIRTAANGTNVGNQENYAVVWLGGEGETPTPLALDALEWWIAELRANGGAGMRVPGHRSLKPTGCPGDPLMAVAARLDGADMHSVEPGPAPAQPPAPAPVPPHVHRPPHVHVPPYPGVTREGMRNSNVTRAYQQRLAQRGWPVVADGDHGPKTTLALRRFQAEKGLSADGVGGPMTWRVLWTAPVT